MKEKVKKPSATEQVRLLKIRIRKQGESLRELLEDLREAKTKFYAIEQLFPKKYYKITFNCKTKAGYVQEYAETKLSIHPRLVVMDLFSRYETCDGFEFLTICEVAS